MAEAKLIYVVDDDTGLRTAYAAALSKLGYRVETAMDGLEAQKLMEKTVPDLILLDMLMPNMDGLTFLRSMRADQKFTEVKVIVASNFESMPEANDYNVSKYISKLQHEPDDIASTIHQLLSSETSETPA